MTIPEWLSVQQHSAGAGHLVSDPERTGSDQPVVNRSEQMAIDTKEILHGFVYREKSLRVGGGLELAHLSFALPRGLMRHLRAIVGILFRAVDHRRHHGSERHRVAA